MILCLTAIWIPIALVYWPRCKSTEQGVTNKRVIHKHGVISRKTDEMRLSAIEYIVISQGIMDRIFGLGKVTITGRGAGDVSIRWTKDPMEVKLQMENTEHVETA